MATLIYLLIVFSSISISAGLITYIFQMLINLPFPMYVTFSIFVLMSVIAFNIFVITHFLKNI